MSEVSMIGIDLAKNSFHLHGAGSDGSAAFRRKLSRGRVLRLRFPASRPRCRAAMEACGSRVLARKPRKLAAVALANRMARILRHWR